MIPSFIMGTGSALGEATIIGSLRNYPKHLINGWSSGTGLAGIFGALLTLIFKLEDIQPQNLYLFVSPLSLIYLFVFIFQENNYLFFLQKNDAADDKNSESEETDSYKPISDSENQNRNTNQTSKNNENHSKNIDKNYNNDANELLVKGDRDDNGNDEDQKDLELEQENNFEKNETDKNDNLNWENFKLAFSYSKFYILNLGMV